MTKQELKEIIHTAIGEVYGTDREEIVQNLQERLQRYSDKDNKISSEKLLVFCMSECMNYTNIVLYSVLSQVLDISE